MEFEALIKAAAQNGIWAIMAVSLIRYILRKNDEREKRYMTTIEKNQKVIQVNQEVIRNMSEALKCNEQIIINQEILCQDVSSIKKEIFRKDDR
jgi:hypothetical protein